MIINKLKLKGKFQEKQNKLKEKFDRQQMENLLKDEEKMIMNYQKSEPHKVVSEPPVTGKGRILTSGKTIHGKDTFFMSEIQTGDKIRIFNDTTLSKDTRDVTLVLSDKSMQIKEPFLQDIVTYSNFEIQKKPLQVQAEDTLEEVFSKKIEMLKKGIQKPKTQVELRLKKKGMWGYQTVRETVDADETHESLLNMRSKKSRDRHCWI